MLVAEFRESIRQAFPQIIALLSHSEWYIQETGADALSKLSVPGKALNFLT
jgi:HEAT repeat protein